MYIVLWCDSNTSPAIKSVSAHALDIACLTDEPECLPIEPNSSIETASFRRMASIEWNIVAGYKIPHNIRMCDNDVFAQAGLLDHRERDTEHLESCSIIVMPASQYMKELHAPCLCLRHPGNTLGLKRLNSQ